MKHGDVNEGKAKLQVQQEMNALKIVIWNTCMGSDKGLLFFDVYLYFTSIPRVGFVSFFCRSVTENLFLYTGSRVLLSKSFT